MTRFVTVAAAPDTRIPLGIENGAKYALIGPTGERATFNDTTDRDHVGFLDGENGSSGLDSADFAEAFDSLVEGDGAIAGDGFLERRPVTLQGIIDPTGGITIVGQRITKLRRIVNEARRADMSMLWKTTGGVPVQIKARRQNFRITGRHPKAFQIGIVAHDPRIYSQELKFLQANPNQALVGGFMSPLTSPLTSNAGVAGQLLLNNIGTFDTPPFFAIYGPITAPVITNLTTGEEMRFTYTLGANEYLAIDTFASRILLNGTADRDDALDFIRSEWIKLAPGVNDVRLSASSYSTGASLVAQWRDAWE